VGSSGPRAWTNSGPHSFSSMKSETRSARTADSSSTLFSAAVRKSSARHLSRIGRAFQSTAFQSSVLTRCEALTMVGDCSGGAVLGCCCPGGCAAAAGVAVPPAG
jgi:hypothetical protein